MVFRAAGSSLQLYQSPLYNKLLKSLDISGHPAKWGLQLSFVPRADTLRCLRVLWAQPLTTFPMTCASWRQNCPRSDAPWQAFLESAVAWGTQHSCGPHACLSHTLMRGTELQQYFLQLEIFLHLQVFHSLYPFPPLVTQWGEINSWSWVKNFTSKLGH